MSGHSLVAEPVGQRVLVPDVERLVIPPFSGRADHTARASAIVFTATPGPDFTETSPRGLSSRPPLKPAKPSAGVSHAAARAATALRVPTTSAAPLIELRS